MRLPYTFTNFRYPVEITEHATVIADHMVFTFDDIWNPELLEDEDLSLDFRRFIPILKSMIRLATEDSQIKYDLPPKTGNVLQDRAAENVYIQKDPRDVKRFLQRAGILDDQGDLSETYGGTGKPTDA